MSAATTRFTGWMENEKNLIADLILAYRKNNRLMQEDFAGLLGVSPQTVSKWERMVCYPDITFLSDIAEVLHVSVGDFFE